MAIKKRPTPQANPAPTTQDAELEQRAEAFGHGAYSPVETPQEVALDPNAPVGPQGIMFRFNDYQKTLLRESADADRRSMQKLLESVVWPELESRRAAKSE